MSVSSNGGTPISHPKMIIFSRKTHGFVGETHHLRKPPYTYTLHVRFWIEIYHLCTLKMTLELTNCSHFCGFIEIKKCQQRNCMEEGRFVDSLMLMMVMVFMPSSLALKNHFEAPRMSWVLWCTAPFKIYLQIWRQIRVLETWSQRFGVSYSKIYQFIVLYRSLSHQRESAWNLF